MTTSIAATRRSNDIGKGGARKARAAGRMPGVIYSGGGEATPVEVDPDRFDVIFRTTKNRNTVLQVEIDGKSTPCLVRELQRHPLTRETLHVDFYALEPGQTVKVQVPVRTSGRAAGASIGGRIRLIRRDLSVEVPWEKIPESIDIDVTPLNIGDFVKVSALAVPAGGRVLYDTDFNVVSCYGKKTGGPGGGD